MKGGIFGSFIRKTADLAKKVKKGINNAADAINEKWEQEGKKF